MDRNTMTMIKLVVISLQPLPLSGYSEYTVEEYGYIHYDSMI